MAIDGVVIRERTEGGDYAWAVRFRRLAEGLSKRLAALIDAEPAPVGGGVLEGSKPTSEEAPKAADTQRPRHGTERGVSVQRPLMTGPAHPAVGYAEAPGEKDRRQGFMTGPAHPALSPLGTSKDQPGGGERPRVDVEVSLSPAQDEAPQRVSPAAKRGWEISLADAVPISEAAISEGGRSKIPAASPREASRTVALSREHADVGGDLASEGSERVLDAVIRSEMDRLYREALARVGDPLSRVTLRREESQGRALATDRGDDDSL